MERDELRSVLDDAYDADDAALQVVTRQARDLADSGLIERDLSVTVSPEWLVTELSDAPDGHDLVDRWNWWIGSLDLSHGGYEQFRVQRWATEE